MPTDLPRLRASVHPNQLLSVPARTFAALSLIFGLAPAPGLHAQHGQSEAGAAESRPRGLQNDPEATRALLDTFALPEGFDIALIASEPHLENPVAFDIGPDGRLYVVETHRLREGVIDMRDHRSWVLEDLANRSVDDRVASIHRHFEATLPEWLSAFERVKTLSDTDGDGVIDRSVVLEEKAFGGFAAGVAAGVLRVGDSVYTTNIPGLFRSVDADGDGIAERTETLHDGFGVHFSLIGHDMHGLILGPDRRLYFSIGDRGFRVEVPGKGLLNFPDEGAVLRCELDGSNLEVLHRGLRNPQELAFDDLGNLFTGDNNSDSVDQARLVLIQPGADSGWRIGHQWLRDRGEWVQEGLWEEVHPGQPAFVMPPLKNLGHGPSGIAFDPGGTLPEPFAGRLFWCDFRGTPTSSKILAVAIEPKGAAFEVTDVQPFLENSLVTDLCFDPDGSIVVSDWVRGWGKTGMGRLHRISRTAPESPGTGQSPWPKAKSILGEGFPGGPTEVPRYLDHPDRRVRMAAHFALVDRGDLGALERMSTEASTRLGRVHAVWGLGLLARDGEAAALPVLRRLLEDEVWAVRAQAARMLGDARDRESLWLLGDLTKDVEAQVQREALHALANLGDSRALEAIGRFLVDESRNGSLDPWLRHAAAYALARCDDGRTAEHDARLLSERQNQSAEVRLACVLAMRWRRSVGIASFLDDVDPRIAAEAARAIHGQRIEAATPFLANTLGDPRVQEPAILWRAIEASRRLGARRHLESLIEFTKRESAPLEMRARALEAVGRFLDLDPQDSVDGLIRSFEPRSRLITHGLLLENGPDLVKSLPEPLATRAVELLEDCRIRGIEPVFAGLALDSAIPPEARARAVEAYARLESTTSESAEALAEEIPADAPAPLTRAVIYLISETGGTAGVERLVALVHSPDLDDQRFALESLARSTDGAAVQAIAAFVDGLPPLDGVLAAARSAEEDTANEGTAVDSGIGPTEEPVEPEAVLPFLPNLASIHEDVLTAAERIGGVALAAAQRHLGASESERDALVAFASALAGGDPSRGREVFSTHPTGQCIRCHTVDGSAGGAGPTLRGVSGRYGAADLLESLVAPSARLATGFAVAHLVTSDGEDLRGTILEETEETIRLQIGETERTLRLDELSTFERAPSTMPPMGTVLTRRELRDLIAYLGRL